MEKYQEWEFLSPKIVRIMKLTLLFALLCMIHISANTYAQTTYVSVDINNGTFYDVVKQIEKQSEYLFFYDSKEIPNDLPVSIKESDSNVTVILDQLGKTHNLLYRINDRHIFLTKGAAPQQKKQVTGIVQDASGESVIGANIMEKGTTNGVITDVDGRFSIHVSSGATLQVSYIGYLPKEIRIGNEALLNIVLEEDTQSLEEVVVVAYGTQKKSNLTGSVEVVTSKELSNRPVASPSALLQGRVSGMTFTTPSAGNAPGSNPVLQIRGQASLSDVTPPLVVIDGIPSDMNDFNAMNPNDIESISVLKDAAASAVYGARAPYGVLMITTKMGRQGEKPSVTYSGNMGIVKPIRMPHSADSYTFGVIKNQALANSRRSPLYTEDELDIIQDNIRNPGKYSKEELVPSDGNSWPGYGYENNDIVRTWLRNSSVRHSHDVSLKGGSEKSSYFVSLGYLYQPSAFNFVKSYDNYTRFNINGGVSTQVNNWLKLTYRARYSYSDSKEPCFDYDIRRSRLYQLIYSSWPTNQVTNPDGTYNERIAIGLGAGNTQSMTHRVDNILALDFDLAKGWTAHVDATWRMNFQDFQVLRKPAMGKRPSGDDYVISGTESLLSKENNTNRYWTVQGYTAYDLKLDKNNFRLQVGMQGEENLYRQLKGTAKQLFVTDMPAISIAQGDRTLNDAINDWATVGFFGRFNYNFDERYFVELNGRYDGSGRYSRGQRWGFFPSAFVAWNMSNEKFWENIKPIVNYSRLKASYGTLGNQGNSAGYLHIPTMSVEAQAAWIIDGKRRPYVKTPEILNMSRTWEKITTLDIGAELRFLANRLSVEGEYFHRRSWDIIGPATPKASVLGTNAPEINNAELTTKGFELQLRWMDQITPDWDYSVGFMLADAFSKVSKYNVKSNFFDKVNNKESWYPGKKMGEIWGYKVDGLLTKDDFGADGKLLVDQSQINANWYPGDVKYKDLDGDGVITTGNKTVENSGDLRRIGNTTPRYRYGLNLATGYTFEKAGRLDLSLFFEGVAKRDLFMGSTYYYFGRGNGNNYENTIYNTKDMLDFYRDTETSSERLLDMLGTNTNAYLPRPYDTDEGGKNFQTNTRYMYSGAYMRLKNLSLSYTLPKDWLNKIKINSLQVYFSGENLFVISSLPSHIDPEVGGSRMYPQTSTYSFGINVGF